MHDATLYRRHLLSLLPLASAPSLARADNSKAVEWMVGYATGGGSSIAADYVARVHEVENTVFTADSAVPPANFFLYSKLTYSAEWDFAPVGTISRFPLVLVVSPSAHHMVTEMFCLKTGLNITHVPYKGAAPAMPDIPTLAEQGLDGFEAYAWQAAALAGTSAATVHTLNKHLGDGRNSAAVQSRMAVLGIEPLPGTPEQLAQFAAKVGPCGARGQHQAGLRTCERIAHAHVRPPMTTCVHTNRFARGRLALRVGAHQAAFGRCSPCLGMRLGGGLRLGAPRRGRDRSTHTF